MKMKRIAFAHSVKVRFIKALLSSWQRKNTKLLYIGLNSTIEPSFFWDMGFDVTYIATTQEELIRAQERNGKKIEYVLAKPDRLPFNEKTFDFFFLAHSLTEKVDEEKLNFKQRLNILNEALRVTAQSICFLEFNTLTFTPLRPALSPFVFNRLSKRLEDTIESEFFSALHLPSFFWTSKYPLRSMLATPLKNPFGAIMAMKINISVIPLTSMPLQVSEAVSEIA